MRRPFPWGALTLPYITVEHSSAGGALDAFPGSGGGSTPPSSRPNLRTAFSTPTRRSGGGGSSSDEHAQSPQQRHCQPAPCAVERV